MQAKYDLVIYGGTVIDPVNNRQGHFDIGVKDGKIVEVAAEMDRTQAAQTINAHGMYIIPGLIDMHVHLSNIYHGQYGHRMLALAGVTTALDMAGPADEVFQIAKCYGAGITVAVLNGIRPGHNVKDGDPKIDELEKVVTEALQKGAIGIKLRGGHYPMTSESTARAISAANQCQAYVAFHAGTTKYGSVIEGGLEAIELAAGQALHLAHVNSYCRGVSRPVLQETEDMVNALTANPNITCESYVSPFNATAAKCSSGQPESQVTRRCLTTGGFEPSEKGLEAAILGGWAHVNIPQGGVMSLATGEKAVRFWRELSTAAFVSFPLNPPEPRFRLATAKRAPKEFVVDGISTDGGAIPRNTIIEIGLSLVKLHALTIQEFVYKTSIRPAAILGLKGKGHLSPGADADLTVIDFGRQKARTTIASGKVIMHDGIVCGSGCQVVTTSQGQKHVQSYGLQPYVIDLQDTEFYRRLNRGTNNI